MNILNVMKQKKIYHFIMVLFLFIFSSKGSSLEKTTVIEINTSNYIPEIKAQVADKNINLLFDTGASTTLILNEMILKAINAQKTGNIKKNIDASGKITVADEVIVPEIILNSLIANNINTYPYIPWGLKFTSNGNEKKGKIPHDFHEKKSGVLGIDFFLKKKIIIDYSSKNIIVFTNDEIPAPYNQKHWIKTNFTKNSEGLMITGYINNKNASFILDTGATASILKPNFIENQNQQCIATLNFNNFQIKNHLFQVVDFKEPNVNGILGYDFFISYLVYVDLLNQHLYLAEL